MKKILNLVIVVILLFTGIFVLAGCNNKENSNEKKTESKKTYAFPVASFIPKNIEYKGSGKVEWSSKNEEITPKYADAYISNAKIEDVVSYVKDLKSKGLHNANAYKEEQTGFDEYGSYSWIGVNDSETFSISVTITEESTKLNLVDASYNLSIIMSDANPYGE